MRLLHPTRIELAERHTVTVIPRRNARRITLRRNSAGELRASVPYGMDQAEATGIIEKLLPRLPEAGDRGPVYRVGTVIECHGTKFHITTQSYRPDHVTASRYADGMAIAVGSRLDFSAMATRRAISAMLCRAAFAVAREILIPHAAATAQRVGAAPVRWEIGRGKRTLGTCHADRHISLSCLLVFLPPHLREYVICHELAHLTEMNHSERFHHLCNQYCHGMEQALRKELKRFKWPVLR